MKKQRFRVLINCISLDRLTTVTKDFKISDRMQYFISPSRHSQVTAVGKGQDNAPCRHSGTKAASVSESPFPWCPLLWLGIENEQEDCPQKSTLGQARKWCVSFSSHTTAYSLVTWPHLTPREAGRMMVVCCGRKGSPLPWSESGGPS